MNGDRRPGGSSRSAVGLLAMIGKRGLIVVASAVLMFPIYWMVTMAFKPQGEWQTTGKLYWVPAHWTLDNFRAILGMPRASGGFIAATEPSAVPAIKNSLIAAGGGTLLALLIGTLAAYGVAHFRSGGRRFPFALLLIRFFPPVVFLIPLFFMVVYVGLRDTYLGLILIYGGVTLPFVVWLMRGFFLDVPREVIDAAVVDGCTQWGAFFKAVLPLVKGGLVATAFFVFILNWSDLLIAIFLTADRTRTATVYLNGLHVNELTEYGFQAAVGLILMFPPLLIGLALRGHLLRGLTFGAIKR
jgi:multiple sugar transport system permease protein